MSILKKMRRANQISREIEETSNNGGDIRDSHGGQGQGKPKPFRMLKTPAKADECSDTRQWGVDTAQYRGESGLASSLLR